MVRAILLLAPIAGLVCAQPSPPAFAVASIRIDTSGRNSMQIRSLGPNAGGRFYVVSVSVRELILLAYGPPRTSGGPLTEIPISGGPEWIFDDRFDIDARAEAGFNPTPEQSQQMLQALLTDRFALRVRREIKDGPVFFLTVAKSGSKLKSPGQTGPPARGMSAGPGGIHASRQPVSKLVGVLSSQAGRKVVDRTGLTGVYDFDLTWTPDATFGPAQPGGKPPDSDPGGPSLFTALQEQLGLKLESGTGPLETVVIERVEKPTDN